MVIIGGLLVLFGLVDLGGSFAGIDVWGDWIGVNLPEFLWRFSAWIEMGIGGFLIKMASGDSDESD